MSWDWFIYFAIASVLFWIIGSWNAFKEFKMTSMYIYFYRTSCLWNIYRLVVVFIGEASFAHNGRAPSVVFFFPAIGWVDYLYEMEV